MNQAINHKMKVFISSKCGNEYTNIRNDLKQKLESMSLFTVYCFEQEPASSEKLRDSYMKQLESADLVVLLVDNKYGITDATLNEYKRAQELHKRMICVFCHEINQKKISIESEIQRTGKCKYSTVDKFSEMADMAVTSVLQDIISVYPNKNDYASMPILKSNVNIDIRRIPDLILINKNKEIIFSYKNKKSPLTQILDSKKYADKHIFLTGAGGQGKSFTLREYYEKNKELQDGKKCIYIDLKMLDERDQESAISKYILKSYHCTMKEIPLKAILLLDGINELPYGLRKVRENGTSFIVTEIKSLLDAPYRVVLCSRNEKISINNSIFINDLPDELSDYNFLHCKINSLRDEQVESIVSESRRLLHILKNNQMLSMYIDLCAKGVKIDETLLCGGVILDKYMDEFIREKARRYLISHDDEDSPDYQIESANDKIDNIYKTLSMESFSSSISTSTFSKDFDLVENLGILVKKDENYIWADEIYQCYFIISILSALIVYAIDAIDSSIKNEHKYTEEEQSMLIGGMVATFSKYIYDFRNGVMNNDDAYSLPMMYDTIQYLGEILLHHNKNAFELLLKINCDDEGFKTFTSIMYYLVSQNYSDIFKTPSYFCNVIFGGMFAECETLQKIIFHPSVTRIDAVAFIGCENLREIVFGENIEMISKQAFAVCSSLDSIHIPSSIKVIGEAAFERCSKLNNLHICDGVETIELRAFYSCKSLKNVFIPKSISTIKSEIFLDCDSLTDVYCEIEEKPLGWDEFWLGCDANVHWGVTRQEYNAITI